MKPPVWKWVIGAFLIAAVLIGVVAEHWEWLGAIKPERETASTTARNIGILFFGFVAIVFAIWRGMVADCQAKASLNRAETSERGLLNERYTQGAEMLGNPVLSVRLAGIYALQRLAYEEPQFYHVQIMRLFCVFVRRPPRDVNQITPPGPQEPKEMPVDAGDALKAILTRSRALVEFEAKENFKLDLADADLSRANLTQAILTEAILTDATLARADLTGARLNGAIMHDAKMGHADLPGAHLTGAQLIDARMAEVNLFMAILTKANLTGAILTNANLTGAVLTGANLTGVNLTEAKFGRISLVSLHGSDKPGDITKAVMARPGRPEPILRAGVNADLRGATLTNAILTGTDLSRADLSKVEGLTQEQLDVACAEVDCPPKLDGAFDAETEKPLEWRGGTVHGLALDAVGMFGNRRR